MSRYILPFWSPIVALSVVGALWLVLYLLPASMWFTVGQVHFSDTKVGESPAMTLDRTIHREFDGTWTVTIRKWDGGWTSFCATSATQKYRPDNVLPKNLSLHWWTWGQCHPLPAGKFEVTTVWNVRNPWPLPDKRIEAVSNVFEVRE